MRHHHIEEMNIICSMNARMKPVMGTITGHRRLSKSIYVNRPEVFGCPCSNGNIKNPIFDLHTRKKNHQYFISPGIYFAKYIITIIVSDAFVLHPRTANPIKTNVPISTKLYSHIGRRYPPHPEPVQKLPNFLPLAWEHQLVMLGGEFL